MAKKKDRAYSRTSRQAVILLGELIRMKRLERKMTAVDLADRAGIDRRTLSQIEKGDMGSQIGLVFEVAALVGVDLFGVEPAGLVALEARVADKIALLPKLARPTASKVKDDF